MGAGPVIEGSLELLVTGGAGPILDEELDLAETGAAGPIVDEGLALAETGAAGPVIEGELVLAEGYGSSITEQVMQVAGAPLAASGIVEALMSSFSNLFGSGVSEQEMQSLVAPPSPDECVPFPDDAFPNTLGIIEAGTYGRCQPRDFAVIDVDADPTPQVTLGWSAPDLEFDFLTMGEVPDDGGVFARVGEAPERVIAHRRELLGYILHKGSPGIIPDGKQLGEGNVLVDQDGLPDGSLSYVDTAVSGGQLVAYRMASVLETGFFNPQVDLPNLALWLDGNNLNTLHRPTSPDIDYWQSRPSGYLVQQATPTNKPHLDSINGAGALLFDAGDDQRLFGPNTPALGGTRGSVFAVVQLVSSGITQVLFAAHDDPSGDYVRVGVDASGRPFISALLGITPASRFATNALTPGIPAVLEWHSNGSVHEIRINGVVETLTGSSSGEWFAFPSTITELVVGADEGTLVPAQPTDARIGALVVVDGAILSSEHKRVTRKYLGDRWGIAVV